MFSIIKKINLLTSISIFRQKIRLLIFYSPIEEVVALRSFINHIIAKFKYILFKGLNLRKQKSSKNFLKEGYATFTNNNINNNCKMILKKLKDNKIHWQKGFNDEIASIYDGDPTKLLKIELINIFTNGVDQFLKEILDSDYKIIFHVLVKSNNRDLNNKPGGSMLWHSDGRNGTRINLQICHTPVSDNNGAMKCLNSKDSKKVHLFIIEEFTKWFRSRSPSRRPSSKFELRDFRVNLMHKYIKNNSIKYFQPNTRKSGLIYAFRNNNIHCGGFPEFGNERIVSIMNIEPSTVITSISDKFSHSHLKTSTNQ